jgi:hypothetical protein
MSRRNIQDGIRHADREYVINEIIDSEVTLTHSSAPAGRRPEEAAA